MSDTRVSVPFPQDNPPVRRGQIPLSLAELAAREIIKATLRDARAIANKLCKRPIGLSSSVTYDPASHRIVLAFHDSATGQGYTVDITPGWTRPDIGRVVWQAVWGHRHEHGAESWQMAQLPRFGDLY
jgi:hypothetical protein